MKNYDENYAIGVAYEKFVYDYLKQKNPNKKLAAHNTKEEQLKGENNIGLEIKRDGKFKETGNLYIEVAEKSRAENRSYVPSGICRKDNTTHYLIGDETICYIFKKAELLRARDDSKYTQITKPTSKGFLLPLTDVNKYIYKTIRFDKPQAAVQPQVAVANYFDSEEHKAFIKSIEEDKRW